MKLVAFAPAKINLCLFVGPVRSDGRHELVTLFESVSLADEVTVAPAAGPVTGHVAGSGRVRAPADQVVCPGIDELNIVTQTLDGLRQRGWEGPPVQITIEKRIPVAGGMAGGSADAAAVLRAARLLAPVDEATLTSLAASLGSDVPSQLRPGLSLGTGAGELLERVDPLAPHAFVIVPQRFGLSTAEVYREADRLGLPRDAPDLARRLLELRAGKDFPFVNDLEPAAISLRPEIGRALDAVGGAGAEHAMVSGSGPTVLGLYWGADAQARARAAAGALADRYPGAVSAVPVTEEFGLPRGT